MRLASMLRAIFILIVSCLWAQWQSRASPVVTTVSVGEQLSEDLLPPGQSLDYRWTVYRCAKIVFVGRIVTPSFHLPCAQVAWRHCLPGPASPVEMPQSHDKWLPVLAHTLQKPGFLFKGHNSQRSASCNAMTASLCPELCHLKSCSLSQYMQMQVQVR